jgi:hypothetical protein
LVGHGLREAGAGAGVGLAVNKSPLLHREVPVRVPKMEASCLSQFESVSKLIIKCRGQ